MELEELKATWERLEKVLERENRLSAEILRQQKVTAVQRSLRPLKLNQALQILFGILFIALAAMLWSSKPSAVPVIVSGAIVQAYGIGCIITAGCVFSSLQNVDYSGPVLAAQSGLAQVRKAYGFSVLVAGLSWWFLWVPLLMLLLGLGHVNLYGLAPSVIWIGVSSGVAGLVGMYCLYRYSVRSQNQRLRRFVELATFGRGLVAAQEQINEIENFENDGMVAPQKHEGDDASNSI
jgi:hypothetical protein